MATPALAEPAKKPAPAAKVAAVKKPATAVKATKHTAKTKHATKNAAPPAKHVAKKPAHPVVVHDIPLPHQRPVIAKTPAHPVVAHDVPLPHQRPVVAKAPEPPVVASDIPLPHQRPVVAKTPEHPVVAHDIALPRQRPIVAGKPVIVPVPPVRASLALPGLTFPPIPQMRPPAAMIPFAVASTTSTSAADIAALRRALEATRKGKSADADAAEAAITDPLARKVAEWAILRADGANAGFRRYVAFMVANPSWSHITLFRKRAESQLWNDQADDATVLAFFAKQQPITAKGRYTLARVLLAKGDRAGAAELVRQAWRNQECSDEIEAKVLEMFGGLLTPADHRARMDRRFYEEDTEAGLRAAKRLGAGDQAVARAWVAVIKRVKNAKALLDSVPAEARAEAGYIFARVRWLRQNDKIEEAGRLILTAPHDPQAHGPDAWWQERRLLVRALLDRNDPKIAYRIAADAALPERQFYRSDRYFTAGWVALRYLNDPKAAFAQFAHIGEVSDSPHALARAGYWQGRAAEAMGDAARAKHFYDLAARQTLTYYGQLARARLGFTDLGLRGPPLVTPQERNTLRHLEIVRAAELLYALNERDLIASMFAEIGENGSDVAGMTMLAEVAAQHNDGRAMVLLGEAAYGRHLPFDEAAYPTVGLPAYRPIAPPIDPAIAYSIARQESRFNQKDVSPAKAMGLMQVTPEAAIDTAKRFKAVYNRGRLLSDAVYNMQMGAGELSNLLAGYNGSYILTFAGYNAGRGRVRQWIAAYGDPRDPGVDPVDWVERIPISETRNYVMRVMENLQVYRARFGGGGNLVIEADLRRGATN